MLLKDQHPGGQAARASSTRDAAGSGPSVSGRFDAMHVVYSASPRQELASREEVLDGGKEPLGSLSVGIVPCPPDHHEPRLGERPRSLHAPRERKRVFGAGQAASTRARGAGVANVEDRLKPLG